MVDILKPDLCVIGAGSGGLSVAAAAAALNVSVVLVEKGAMGGDCLNSGCVPSKSLIASANRAQAMREAAAFGIGSVDPQINFRRIHDHIHGVIGAIRPTDSVERFRAMGVNVLGGEARFADRRTVLVGDQVVKARRFVIATGSRPTLPPIPGLKDVPFHTNETIFSITRKPAHLLVVGAGPIGLELAQAFRRLGSVVTVLETAEPLSREDPELAEIVLDSLFRDGVKLRRGAEVTGVEARPNGIRVRLEAKEGTETIDASDLLVATGRTPTVEGLDLEKAKIDYDTKNGIRVNARLKTSNRRVFAIGDVAGGPQFTHVANYHAGIVIRNALFRLRAKATYDHVPRVTFTDPELAQVGLTEAEARERHRNIRILRWPYADNDRARAERQAEGHVKVVATDKGRILGAGIAGARADDIIQVWSLAILKKLDIKSMTEIVPAYPTFGEIGKRAAMEYYRPSLTRPLVRRIISFLRLFG